MERDYTKNLFRQLDSIRVFAVLLVFSGQNLFEPLCLSRSGPPVGQGRIVENGKLFSAAVTSKSSHILHFGRSFSCLPLLYRYRLHAGTQFYPAFRSPPI
jgi:hypothetical protein